VDSSEKESRPSPLSSPTLHVAPFSSRIGQAYQPGETYVISAGFPCQDISVAGRRKGLSGSQSSLMFALVGWLSKTRITPGASGCPNCGAACGLSGMPLCVFECEPQKLARGTIELEHSLLPTPTASSYGSCRGGGAGRVGKWRLSLDSLGIRDPEQRERMMGFPPGWTAAMRSVTRSVRKSLSSSPAASSPSPNSFEG
jgi:hypothetical protein